MDLRTTYLGLPLAHPLMPGASPLVDDLDTVKRLEDAGASAIVMHSLFEEQISREGEGIRHAMEDHAESFAEATSYFPAAEDFALGPDRYLEQIRKIRAIVSVPVIASLNGVTDSGWLRYAKLMQQAGAHALELNVYRIAADPNVPGTTLEHEVENILQDRQARPRDPGRREAPAFLHVLRERRASARRPRSGRPRPLQPLLPARHRRRPARAGPRAPALRLLGPPPAPALARDPVRPRALLARRHGRRSHADRPREGDHGGRPRRPDRLGDPAARAAADHRPEAGPHGMDGEARVRVRGADDGLP